MEYTNEELEQLELEEYSHVEETIALAFLILSSLKFELETELTSFYRKYGKDGVVTYNEAKKWINSNDHRKRLTVLLLFIGQKFDDLSGELENKFKSLLSEIIAKESGFFDVSLDIDDLLYSNWGADELNWLTRLNDDVKLWSYNVAKDIKQNMLKQQSIDMVLENITTRFTSIEKILKGLVITESSAMGSLARRKIFKELGIKKYRFYAREDERVCEHCGGLHGLEFPMASYEVGVNASPIHPRCRCWEVPIIG